MARVTIGDVRDAFALLYESIHDREFRKSLRLHEWNEKRLLPLVRTFLLGYFRHCSPEVEVKLASSATGWGRIDFKVGNVAVEFAVRRPMDRKGPISSKVNTTEMIKLMTYDGPGLLVLFDFSKHHFDEDDIERFRDYPSLGRGRFHRSAFNVAYFYREQTRPRRCASMCRNIRVAKRA